MPKGMGIRRITNVMNDDDEYYADFDDVDEDDVDDMELGLLLLEDKNWDEAYEHFDNMFVYSDQEDVQAYIGRQCAELKIGSIEEFTNNNNIAFSQGKREKRLSCVDVRAGHLWLERDVEEEDDKDDEYVTYGRFYGTKWQKAQAHFEEALKTDPENAPAFIGKMMAEHHIERESGIADYFFGSNLEISDDKNYKNALRFADAEYKKHLESYKKTVSDESTAQEGTKDLDQIRKNLSKYKGYILAKDYNTFALTLNGSVLAAGDNRDGQCDTSGWRNITSVAFGGHHVIGLKKNGTVVAAGARDSFINLGQCRTENWTDIKAIATSAFFTVGIKSNGSLVHCGDAVKNQNAYSSGGSYTGGVLKNVIGQLVLGKLVDWSAVYASIDEIFGLKKDGTVETINSYDVTKNWRGIIDIVASHDVEHVVALKANGTVVAIGNNKHGQCKVNNWSDIVALSTGGGRYHPFTVGLKSNGTVVAAGDNEYGQCKTSDWRNIVAIAAGGYHTVGLKADGTVVAAGSIKREKDEFDVDFGQCKTSEWQDIVAIAAGDCHTIGLKPNGTVVATGSNEKGQCNVQNWRNVGSNSITKKEYRKADAELSAIMRQLINEYKKHSCLLAASASRTFGLKDNGSIVAIGNNQKIEKDWEKHEDKGWVRCDVSGWRNIVAIYGKAFHIVGLKSDGSVVAAGASARTRGSSRLDVSEWQNIISISASKHLTLGLKSDGSVVSAGSMFYGKDGNEKDILEDCDVSDWRDIIEVAAGFTFAAGLKANGTVVAVGKILAENEFVDCDFSHWSDVCAISACTLHLVGLRSDGTVIAEGCNNDGQCNVSDWRDIVAVSAGYNHTVGIRMDGTAIAVGSNEFGKCNISGWKSVTSINAGLHKTVGIADGVVVAVGSNEFEDCNVSSWRDIGSYSHEKASYLEQEDKRRQQVASWIKQGLCRYCGGQVGGLFTKKCKRCRKEQ
ncbi:MAG: hypothetical protein LBU32_24710 [Clostridiales bacterium]|jgi:alpha-tubulin suppressor-like RCC1 family protein|nr:hypothetical protein [Clostridiales bacterium]